MSTPPFAPSGSNATPLAAFRPEDVISCEQLENSVSGILDSPICETPTSTRRLKKPIARQAKPSYSNATPSYANSSLDFMPVPSKVLDDLCMRFIDNLPDSEKEDPIRVLFQAEQAHWFYVDYYCEAKHSDPCPNLGFRDFVRKIFNHSHSLAKYANQVDELIEQFRQYKSLIPTYGAVMFDPSFTQILLVQGYFASRNSWGFPKGKVNEDEDPKDCAIREVLEETGYDISLNLVPDVVFRYAMNDTMVHLYVAVDVDRSFNFHPHLRKEIRKIAWFDIADLPRHKTDFATCNRQGQGCRPNNFYGVLPAVDFVRKFAAEQLKSRRRTGQQKVSAFEPVIPRGKGLPTLPPQSFHASHLESAFMNESGSAGPSTSTSASFPFVGYAQSSSGFHSTATPASTSDLFASLRLDSPTASIGKKFEGGEELLKSLMSTPPVRPNSLYASSAISASAQEIGVIGEEREHRQEIKHPIPIQPNSIMKPNSLGRMSFNPTPRGSFANIPPSNMSSVSLQNHFRSFSGEKTATSSEREEEFEDAEPTIDGATPPLLPADLLASSPATHAFNNPHMTAQAHLEACRRALHDSTLQANDRRQKQRAAKRTPKQQKSPAPGTSGFSVGAKSPASTASSSRPTVSDLLSNMFSAARSTGGVIKAEDLEAAMTAKPTTPVFYVDSAVEDSVDEKTAATSETTIDKYARSEITSTPDSIHNYFSVGEDGQSGRNSGNNSAPTFDVAALQPASSSGGNTSDDEATPLHSAAQRRPASRVIRGKPIELCRAWENFHFDLSQTNLSGLLG